jgi:hypothetical protein
VIMALPISKQPEIILKCFRAGKHVLSEVRCHGAAGVISRVHPSDPCSESGRNRSPKTSPPPKTSSRPMRRNTNRRA